MERWLPDRIRAVMSPGHAWFGYAGLSMARLLAQVVGTVLTVVSARVLAPEGRGEFVALSATAVLTAQMLNLGLSSSLAVLFSRRPARIGLYRRHLVHIAFGWASLLVVLAAALALLAPGIGLPWWPLCAVWVPLQLLGLYQAAALVALQDAGRCRASSWPVGRAPSSWAAPRSWPSGAPCSRSCWRSSPRMLSSPSLEPEGWPRSPPSRPRADGRPWRSFASRIDWACVPTRRCCWASS